MLSPIARTRAFMMSGDGSAASEYAALLGLVVCVAAVALHAFGGELCALLCGVLALGGPEAEPVLATGRALP